MPDETRQTLKDFFNDFYTASGDTCGTDSITLSNIADKNATGKIDEGDDLGTTPIGTADTPTGLLDLDSTEISILGDYLSYITQHFSRSGPNEFFIERLTTEANDTDRGTPIESPSANKHGADDTFTERNDLSDTLADYSNSQQFDIAAGNDLAAIINKTGNPDSDAPSGHELLSGITGDESPPAPPVASSFEILKKNNRFNTLQEKEYGYDYVKDGSTKAFALGQTGAGTYEKYDGIDGHPFNFEQLKNVGYEMLKNASQFSNTSTNVFAEDVSPRKTEHTPFTYNYATEEDPLPPPAGAFEEAQANQKIKKSFTSPDNKFITADTYTTEDINNDYFRTVIENFRIKLNEKMEAGKTRDNNSVYTVNTYQKSVLHALDVLFPGEEGSVLDPFYSNIANVMSKIIAAEDDESDSASAARAKLDGLSIATKFLDNMAVIGDIMLTLAIKSTTANNVNILNGGYTDVDDLDEGPATRISKSKTTNSGPNSKSLAWRGSSLPSLYHLPASVVRSMQNMGAVNGQNPMKGMLAGGLTDKTYMSAGMLPPSSLGDVVDQLLAPAKGKKIPKMLVQRMEDQLDAEYVPFYFHDLRTNEIISFHAFLDDLTDGFTANYEDNDGFGRMDPVRIYKNTTRDIGFTFKVAATSEQDFDEMWFKINKLITLLYPQWSAGEQLKAGDSSFTRPFSQVPVASPVIRLRIGDVIKSNYSRFNLSRIFGSGHPETNINPGDVGGTSILAAIGLLTAAIPGVGNLNHGVQAVQITLSKIMLKLMMMVVGSPLQYVEMIPDESMMGIVIKDIAFDLLSAELRNGFMSPAVNVAFDRLRDPDGPEQNSLSFGVGAQIGDAVMLKPSNGKYYISPGEQSGVKDTIPIILPGPGSVPNNTTNIGEPYIDGMLNSSYEKYITTRHIKCRVVGKKKNSITGKTHYNIVAVTTSIANRWGPSVLAHDMDPVERVGWKNIKENVDVAGRIFNVTYDDFVIDPDYLFGAYFSLLLDPVTALLDQVQGMIDTFAGSLGISTDNINLFTTSFEDLMHPVNNSITKAFETTSGRGMAGVISSMSFNWIDGDNTPWETSFGSRAPKICNIKIKFEPIHDIAPGLDVDGFNRAPTHNVGSIMNNIAGDPYEKGFDSAKKSFDNAMNASTNSNKTS